MSTDEASRLVAEAAMFNLAMGGDGNISPADLSSLVAHHAALHEHIDSEDDSFDDEEVEDDHDQEEEEEEEEDNSDFSGYSIQQHGTSTSSSRDVGYTGNIARVTAPLVDNALGYFPLPGKEVEVLFSLQDSGGTGLLYGNTSNFSGLRKFHESTPPLTTSTSAALPIVPIVPSVEAAATGRNAQAWQKIGGKKLPNKRGRPKQQEKIKVEKKIRTAENLYCNAQDQVSCVAVVLNDLSCMGSVRVSVHQGVSTIHACQYELTAKNLSNLTAIKMAQSDSDLDDTGIDNKLMVEIPTTKVSSTLPNGWTVKKVTSTVSEILLLIQMEGDEKCQLFSWPWSWISPHMNERKKQQKTPLPHSREQILQLKSKNIIDIVSTRLRTFILLEGNELCTFVDQRLLDILAIQVNGDVQALSEMQHRLEFSSSKFLIFRHCTLFILYLIIIIYWTYFRTLLRIIMIVIHSLFFFFYRHYHVY